MRNSPRQDGAAGGRVAKVAVEEEQGGGVLLGAEAQAAARQRRGLFDVEPPGIVAVADEAALPRLARVLALRAARRGVAAAQVGQAGERASGGVLQRARAAQAEVAAVVKLKLGDGGRVSRNGKGLAAVSTVLLDCE